MNSAEIFDDFEVVDALEEPEGGKRLHVAHVVLKLGFFSTSLLQKNHVSFLTNIKNKTFSDVKAV
jgi:hypothetical protein